MRGPNGPNHYDELKRGAAGPYPPPAPEPVAAFPEPAPTPEALRGPGEAWGEAVADKAASEAAKIDTERTTPRDAIYEVRQEDNARLVAQNVALLHQEVRDRQAQEIDRLATENTQKLVQQAETMRELHTRFDALGQNPTDLVEQRILDRAGGRQSPHDNYHQAMREQQDNKDPYGTMARAAMAEHSAFTRDQDAFDERIEKAASPDERRSLEQQKDIQAADHIAATSHRIADQAEIISGVRHNDDATVFRERAEEFEARSGELRDSYRERTGRDAAAQDSRAPSVSDDEPARQTRSNAGGDEAGPSRPASGDAKAEWSDANIEITDAKAERLAMLSERFHESEGAGAAHAGPIRPRSGGSEM